MDGRRKRSRGRSAKHAGVVLYSRTLPSGAIAWRARYIDPDNGRKKHETLPAALTTEEQRLAWAATKSQTLKKREAEVAEGAPTKKNMRLADVIERYFENESPRLRPKTIEIARSAANTLLAWARARGVELSDDLTVERLADLCIFVKNRPLMRRGPDGRHVATNRVRSPASIKQELGALKTILEHLRPLGLVPMLRSKDAIRDTLKAPKQPKPLPMPLKPAELLKLIEAAKRHDEDVFDLTREEKDRGLTKGATPRHPPVLPYIALALLSGMRADEARTLRWDAVDLMAAPAGTITLCSEETKTKHGRIVDLGVSPALRALLGVLKIRAGDAAFVFEDVEIEDVEARPISRATLEAARKRLVRSFGAPRFSWQRLRVTCGTYLANAPGIFGAASAYREAKQLGHGVAVAERHYLGVVHVPMDAKTLEAAMTIEDALRAALHVGGSEVKVSATAAI